MTWVVVGTQALVAAATSVTLVVAWHDLNGGIQDGAAVPHPPNVVKPRVAGPQEPLNVLIIGSDSRDGAGNGIDRHTGEGQRSDVVMLLHLSADREEAYGVSLPRDAVVDRPACTGRDGDRVPAERDVMFNTAFQVGGPECTAMMVQSLTGVYVDHYVVVDFGGFVDMVDAVGGVDVCLPEAVADPESGIFLDAGQQTLDGQQSLDYVRERKQLSVTGDIGRMKRQQAFVASLVNKVVSAGTLSRPYRVHAFLKAVVGSLQVDEGLDSLRELTDLALQLRRTGLDDISFVTVPFEEYPPDPYRLQWAPQAERLWARVRADRPLGGALRDEAITADRPPGRSGDGPPGSGGGGSAEDERAEALSHGLCP